MEHWNNFVQIIPTNGHRTYNKVIDTISYRIKLSIYQTKLFGQSLTYIFSAKILYSTHAAWPLVMLHESCPKVGPLIDTFLRKKYFLAKQIFGRKNLAGNFSPNILLAGNWGIVITSN